MVLERSRKIVGIDGDNVCFQAGNVISEYCNNNGIVLSLDAQRAIAIGTRESAQANWFLDNHIRQINDSLAEMPRCIETLEFLRAHGILTALITRRGSDLYPDAEKSTAEFVKRHGYPFDFVHCGIVDKAAFCRNNGIWLLVDDSISTCEKTQTAGVPAIVFNSDLNRGIITNCPRAEGWQECRNLISIMALQGVLAKSNPVGKI